MSHPPEPPLLPLESVHALIDWVDATAMWLRQEQAEAARHGHREHAAATQNLRLYEAMGVLLREAYETRMEDL